MRNGQAAQLYTGADTGANPQKLVAPAGSPLFRIASAEGLPFVGLYVYPPILANLLVPLAALHAQTAATTWLALNAVFLVLTAWLLTRLIEVSAFGWQALLLLASLACFTPVLQCLHDGQITLFLLMLWVAGMVLYKKEQTGASAAIFALATAIKLTPALVLLPFLIWRRWRFVTAYLASLATLTLLCLWIDTPHAFAVYFGHVLPAMSGPVLSLSNYSLAAAAERVVAILRTGTVLPVPETLPATTALAGRAISTGVLLWLIALLVRAGRNLDSHSQLLVLGLLGLMAPILSPVSWFHAYATSFVAFVLLWRECLQNRPSFPYLMLLTVVSLLLGSAASEHLLVSLASSARWSNLATYLQCAQLMAASGLCLYRISTLDRHSLPT